MKRHRHIIIIAIVSLTFAAPAFAYLDPGSGSIILQGLLAAIAGTVAGVKFYWQKLKNLCLRCLGKSVKTQEEQNNKQEVK